MRCLTVRSILSALLVASLGSAMAQPTREDELVRAAVSAALLGNTAALEVQANERRTAEENADGSLEELSGNIRALAVATSFRQPTVAEAKHNLSGYRTDSFTRNVFELIRRHEPRQRFLEARKDRRYNGYRRAFNGVAVPLGSALQGQLFDLITIPFEAVDYLVIGTRYPTPESRKEIYTARDASAVVPSDSITVKAMDVLEERTPELTLLAALQAKQNGERALKQGRPETALFWYGKEKELRGWTKNERRGHREALRIATRERAARQAGLTVLDGDVLFGPGDEFRVYTNVLTTLLADDPAGFISSSNRYLIDHPLAAAADDVRAARAAEAWQNEERQLALVNLDELAAREGDDAWSTRARNLRERPDLGPENALADAQAVIDARFRSFLFAGSDPGVLDRTLTADEARLRRHLWIYRARGLFITDTIARAISLPFLDPFPKPELLDTAAQVAPGFFETETGRPWLEALMNAQKDERRFTDAAGTAKRLGEFDKAQALERREARRLEKLADSGTNPRERLLVYRRIINAYPSYKHIDRVRESLEMAELAAETQATLSTKELAAWPQVAEALSVPADLYDGKAGNGEIDSSGLAVLSHDSYVYTDRQLKRRIEVPIAREKRIAALRALEPTRRAEALDAVLAQPGSRKKIPIALEAGIFPGFDVGPEVVPLDPNRKERELYR